MNALAQDRSIRELVDQLTVDDAEPVWIDTASDPVAVDRLAEAIAGRLREFSPDAVACWTNVDDAVLAHGVARHLGVPVRRIEENLGLLTLEPDVRPGERAVLLASRWTLEVPMGPLYSLLENRGGSVVGVVSVLPGAGRPLMFPREIPFLVLADS